MKKVCVVTGGSRGIGLSVVSRLLSSGHIVYDLSRNKNPLSEAEHIDTDVSDERSVSIAVSDIVRVEDRIDLVVCCAGFGISGAVEFTDINDAKHQMDVNFFGSVNIIKQTLGHLRRSRGRIICVSSVAAALQIPFQAYYSASKAAINALVMAVSNEVRDFGVSVCAVMPGDVSTSFTVNREKSEAGDDVYSGKISRSVAIMERDEENGMSPDYAAKIICRVAEKNKVKPFYTVGFKYKLFLFLNRLLPVKLVGYLIGKIYN